MSHFGFAVMESSVDHHPEFQSLDVEEQQSPATNVAAAAGSTELPGEEEALELAWKDQLRAYLRSQDFLELVVCAIFFVVSFVPYVAKPEGNQRPIPYQYLQSNGDYVRNLVNNELSNGPTVSTTMLFVLGFLLPLVLQLLASITRAHRGDVHATLCVVLVAHGITLLITEWIKLYVGYLRPIFYEYCVPNDDYSACTSEDSDVRKSFPSGHASTSFCGLAILTMYLHRRFGIASVRAFRSVPMSCGTGHRTITTDAVRWKVVYLTSHPLYYRLISVLSLAPMALAIFIAASRVVNNKHFPADVVGGAILGTGVSVYVNGLWFAD